MIIFVIDCNVPESEARGSMPKVDKSENSAEGRCGWTQTHSWRTAYCSLSTDSLFRELRNGPSASLTASTGEGG